MTWALLGAGCKPAVEKADPSADGGGPDDSGAPADVDGGDASTPDAGTMLADGGPNQVPGPTPPSLESALVRQVGRFGRDVRIDVTGSDSGGDITTVRVTLLDGVGSEVLAFDSDGDGMFDSGQTTLPLDVIKAGETKLTSYVLMPFMYTQYPYLTTVKVSLVDALGTRSEELSMPLQKQPVLALDALCDGSFLKDRCAPGLGCKGQVPQVCTEGEAPILKQTAYLDDELGRRLLVEGLDADADVVAYAIEFLDANNQTVMMDLDGDGKDESSGFTGDVTESGADGAFFVAFQPSEEFTALVAKVVVSVRDLGERTSAKVTLEKKVALARSAGAACDPRGFDRCTANNVCSPGVTSVPNRCTAISTARTQACNAALVLDPAKGKTSVQADLSNISVWDSPSGCSSNDPKHRPEAVVKLVLSQPATKVTLSTDNGYTNFDTTLYALSACSAAPLVAWCADDQLDGARAQLAVLELDNVPAGEYFVVVDSFPSTSTGKRFQLDVTVR